MMRVKVCGITNLEDALAASDCGADALGFVFYHKSPRYIDPRDAARIIEKLPPYITPVALFVNEDEREVHKIMDLTTINVLQFHGDESPVYVASFYPRVTKAIRVDDASSLRDMDDYDVSAFLLDAYSADQYGGTGSTFNWDLLRGRDFMKPVVLAGGLTPENVEEAILQVRPYGVDVSSGIEKSPGLKDHDKMKVFIEKAKGALP